MKQSISSILNLKTETVVICPVTGISYSINVPNMGIDFTFQSPFCKYENVEAVMKRNHLELRKLPKTILAGITLAALKYNDMITFHNISVFEANTYFQLLPTAELISALKTISYLTEYKAKLLPTLSLDALKDDVEFSTRTNLLLNFLKACADVINPPAREAFAMQTTITTSFHGLKARKAIKTVAMEDKKKMKEAVSILAKDTLTSSKMAGILFNLCEGNILIGMDNTIRAKIIDKLDVYETEASETIIFLLNKYNNTIEDDAFDRISDDFAITKTRKTLAEILADRKASAVIKGY